MSKKKKKTLNNQNVAETSVEDKIKADVLVGALFFDKQYKEGVITKVSEDETKITARFDFDGLEHQIDFMRIIPGILNYKQIEEIYKYIDQSFGNCSCNRCKERLFPNYFSNHQKKIYDLFGICEKCEDEKYECPICYHRFSLIRKLKVMMM